MVTKFVLFLFCFYKYNPQIVFARVALTNGARAVVVAELVDQSLPTPEIRNSNHDIGKILSTNCTIEKTKIKKKRLGMAHLFTNGAYTRTHNVVIIHRY